MLKKIEETTFANTVLFIYFFSKKNKIKKKKNHDFIEKGNLSEKVVIVDEELDDTDIDDIRNLGDSPKLVFINEEYGNLRWFL